MKIEDELRTIDGAKNQFEQTGYWLCDKCGLVHGHHPDQETVRRLLENKTVRGPSDYDHSALQYNERCNCGLHEAYVKCVTGEIELLPEERDCLMGKKQYRPIPGEVEEAIYDT